MKNLPIGASPPAPDRLANQKFRNAQIPETLAANPIVGATFQDGISRYEGTNKKDAFANASIKILAGSMQIGSPWNEYNARKFLNRSLLSHQAPELFAWLRKLTAYAEEVLSGVRVTRGAFASASAFSLMCDQDTRNWQDAHKALVKLNDGAWCVFSIDNAVATRICPHQWAPSVLPLATFETFVRDAIELEASRCTDRFAPRAAEFQRRYGLRQAISQNEAKRQLIAVGDSKNMPVTRMRAGDL